MSGPQGGGSSDAAGDAGRAAQERLTEEARATASALLDWLGTRVDRAPGAPGPRPAQSAGPCTWCPLCALVAALRGEQPELTARLAEHASGVMALLRLMVQAHQDPGHAHHTPTSTAHPTPPPGGDPGPPPGWPPEWGAWDGWGTGPPATQAAAREEPQDAAAPRDEHAVPTDDAPTADATADATSDATSDATGAPGADATAEPPGPPSAGGRRRPPVRRASPRSAAFRGLGVPGTDGTTEVPPTGAPPDPAPEAPRAARPARGARVAPPASGGTARPSVQRIAIRRPPRRDGAEGPDSGASC
ncbi:hypothetical protein [Actinomycetospora cinnamomea]|uniref:Uncharacterized protein n=1 Tax=Actinomycetospora cinnamomea TaxID=663609 RepID=A0A2U1F9X7_9PSEU|nr:hypothetical protein [Actinomycetospora cinnamomea]PVZ08949.1 hypothetical protein C8D89_107111 [Actinomycetospora cinnamomea]